MRRVQRLLALQETDLELDASRRRMREVDALLTESDALRAARQSDQHIQQRLAQLRPRLKDLGLESSALDGKITNAEDRLYSGAIKNPKELSDLQKDVTSLRKHKSELDERQLELMLELEQIEQEAARVHTDLIHIEAEWQREQATLQAQRASLIEHIETLDARRQAQRAEASAPDLAAYDQLRARKHGQVVATIEEGACGVCGVEISEYNMAKAQRDDALIPCGNCERLLIAR